MPKKCCGQNYNFQNNRRGSESSDRDYYSERPSNSGRRSHCDKKFNPYICDPCNFSCPSTPQLPPTSTPPPPPELLAHLLLDATYDEATELVTFLVQNSVADGATTAAENTVVLITPDPSAIFTLDDIVVSQGTVEILGDGNIEWSVGTLGLDADATITIAQALPTAVQTWVGIATTTTPNFPVNNDNEASVTFGGGVGGNLLLDLVWNPNGGVDGEMNVTVTNNGTVDAIDVIVELTPTILGLTEGDIIWPVGTTGTVDPITGVVTWNVGLLPVGADLTLTFPQRPVIAPDQQIWAGIALADNFVQTNGENEASDAISLELTTLELSGTVTSTARDDLVVVSFVLTNTGANPTSGASLSLAAVTNPGGAPVDLAGLFINPPSTVPAATVDANFPAGTIDITGFELAPGESITLILNQLLNATSVDWNAIGSASNVAVDVTESVNVPVLALTTLSIAGTFTAPTLEFVVTNTGSENAINIEIEITPSLAIAIAEGDITITSVGTYTAAVNGTIITVFGDLGYGLPPGETITISFDVPEGSPLADWQANAIATNAPLVTTTVTDVVGLTTLGVSAIVDATPGDPIDIVVTLTNNGPNPTNSVLLNLEALANGVPADLTGLLDPPLASIPGATINVNDNPGTISVTDFELAPGENIELTFNQILTTTAIDWNITGSASNVAVDATTTATVPAAP